MRTTYLTVAIPYVNADPHLGYADELVRADIVARARRRRGDALRFVGGTDDLSLKNVLAAEAAGVPVADFVAQLSERFASLSAPLDLSFDDFVRTSTDPRHRPAVERLWRLVDANGDLYTRRYEGDYCVGCEQFYGAAELVDGSCPEHGAPLERVVETNWFFRLSRYQEHLEDLIESGRLAVEPEPFRNEVLSFIRGGLDDISVSRTVERARGWGIPVPGDPTQVVYVWFDALTNYLSGLDFGDPHSQRYRRWWLDADERIHVVGKGILRFHAVHWPAFLAAAGQPAPTQVRVHPYLTVDGRKISKSSGTAVDPVATVERVGTDALRWWFARDVHPVSDSDFTLDRLIGRVDEDLARGVGNLVNRITTLVHRSLDGGVPAEGGPAVAGVGGLEDRVVAAVCEFDLRRGTQLIVEAVGAVNRDLEATAPWALAKNPAAQHQLVEVLGRQHRAAVEIGRACAPIVPRLSAAILRQLGVGQPRLPPASPLVRRLGG